MKKRLLSLVMCGALALTMLAGCSSNGGGSTSTDGGSGTQTQAPADDNSAAGEAAETMTFAQGADPRGLDPAYADDGESSKVMVNVYEGLLQYAPDSTDVEPCLAESWTISDDKLTYTFKLRQGVKFHDGTDFNAEAVKWNIDRSTVNANENMAYAGFVYAQVESCTVVDEYTVEIKLTSPCTPFLNNLAMSLGSPMVSPTACEANDNDLTRNPVGTGPYKFVSWSEGEAVVLERFDDYWGEPAKSKNLIFRTIADNSARVLALSNGEVDMIDGIDATVVDQITNSGNVLFNEQGMNVNYMAYNVEKLSDPEVRKALSQAVNVQELVEAQYKGYASQATTILPDFIPGYSADVKQTEYDPEAAKATLAAKGVTEVHAITYTNPRPYNTIGGQTLAEAIQGYLAEVGVTMTIDPYDWTTYKEIVANGDYDICFYGWVGDNGDADNFLNLLSDQDPTMNVARYQSDEYDALIKEGLETDNGDERNAIYAQAEQLVADENIWLLISHSQLLAGYSPSIQDFNYHCTGNTYLSQTYKLAQ